MTEEAGKKVWTDEERLKLSAELDSQLDDYINSLEPKPYTEGWPEDRWEAEMDKHPFFMKELPENGEEVSPLVEGLQQLKYGEEDNTPEELAANYKEDGNFYFKNKNFKRAILNYAEGLRTKCEDKSLRAQLYNNRAAAHFMLKNYRSSLQDSLQAMKLDPKYHKAHSRAAICFYHVKKYLECINLCDKYLKLFEPSKEISELKRKAIIENKQHQRDLRKQEKKEKENTKVLRVIKERKINIELSEEDRDLQLSDLVPKIPQLAEHRVKLTESDRLVWPVMILYPESMQSDFIQNFDEDTSLEQQLELFDPPEWDTERRYSLPNLSVYFQETDTNIVHKVDMRQNLGSILQNERFRIRDGTPTFLILVASSDAEKDFLKNHQLL